MIYWFSMWPVFVAALLLSFLLSGMEAGVFALNRMRIRQQTRAGKKSARLLHQHLEHPETFLWTILVGNTIAIFFILGWLFLILEELVGRHPAAFAAGYAGSVFLFYAFFDLLPKTLFRRFPNRLCLVAARPFSFIHLALRPLVALVEWFSALVLRWRGGAVFKGHLFGNREELRVVMQESAHAFSSEERGMINRVLDLQTITVRTIMTPLSGTVIVPADLPLPELLAMARERRLTRLPVFELRNGRQRIIGLVTVSSVLYAYESPEGRTAAQVAKPALYLEEDLRLEVALRRMQRSGHRLAIVLGRDRFESGVVSLQDILKFIVGGLAS